MTDEQMTPEQRIALQEAQAAHDKMEFARQLATLNAHPERWALVELSIGFYELIGNDNQKISDIGELGYWKVDSALKWFDMDVSVDDARALLAARETESEDEDVLD